MPVASPSTRRRPTRFIALRLWLAAARGTVALVRGPVDLAIRLYLAQAFVVANVMAMAGSHGSTAMLVAGSGLAGLALSLGLFTRLGAGALLVEALAQQLGLEASEPNLFIIALLGWFVVRGPGALSIDRAVAAGLRASALPLAQPVMRALDALRRTGAPAYLLLVRLWLAAAIAGLGGDWPWLPAATFMGLPLPVRLVAGALIALGLALPPVLVLLLFAFAGIEAFDPASQLNLYLLLLLAVIGLRGGGLWTLDARIAEALHRRGWFDRPRDPVPAEWPHVVIVGAGFGGLACAAGLRALPLRVTLIDRHNYHLFQPLLYQVATGSLSPADIATPIRALFRDDRTVAVRLGTVTGVDCARQTVALGDDTLAYDWLVIATGAQHSYFGREDWAPFAPGLKRVEDAIMARSKVLTAFERAETEADPERRQRLMTFVIIGAGPTGVELAGAIAELAHAGLCDSYRAIDTRAARIILVQSGDRVLPSFPPKLSEQARAALVGLGVEIRLNATVTAIDAQGVTMGDARIEAETVLWAAGVVASPAATWLGAACDRAGRVVVGDDLGVSDCPGVFVIGDTAASAGWDGKPVPGLAPAAKQGGAHVAKVIAAQLAGRKAPPPFRYRHSGSLATIGRKAAVADFGFAQVSGALAWWLWGAIHVAFLVGVRNRLAVMLNWVWSYLSLRITVQLITGAPR